MQRGWLLPSGGLTVGSVTAAERERRAARVPEKTIRDSRTAAEKNRKHNSNANNVKQQNNL